MSETILIDQRTCSFTVPMERGITSDDDDAHLPSRAEHPNQPHQSSPDNNDIRSPTQASNSRLPRRIAPNDVDIRWPYRAGFPRLLRPYVDWTPIEAAENPIPDAKFEHLRSRIFEILKSYDLPWWRSVPSCLPKLVYRKLRFGDAGLPRVLIHCSYDKDTSYSRKWTVAVAEIYAEIQSMVEGDHEVGIELADMEFMESHLISLPTPVSKDLSANWENGQNYCDQISQLLGTRRQMYRMMMPMGRRSVGDLTSELTEVIFIDAEDAEDDSWDSIEGSIRSILPSHIDIDIRQGSGPSFCFLVPENSSKRSITSPEEYTRPPRPGCDIGVMGSHSAGTMGGYVVTADENGKKTTYGVTNAHVALQSREKCTFTASADSGIRMASPSEESRAETQLKLRKELMDLEKRIKSRKDMLEANNDEDPESSQKIRKFLALNESRLASMKSALGLINQDSYIGTVYNAMLGDIDYSQASRKIMMDLALIKMDCLGAENPQEIYLKARDSLPSIEADATCDFWETDSLGVSRKGNRIKVVGKLSRSGIYSFGIVNDFRAELFPFFEYGLKTGKKTYAWAVSSDTEGESFSGKGDSGSFVIAAQGWEYQGRDNRVPMPSGETPLMTKHKCWHPFIVGLLFATTETPPLSYFIPFDAVKSQIESLTGEKLIWPENRTNVLGEDVA